MTSGPRLSESELNQLIRRYLLALSTNEERQMTEELVFGDVESLKLMLQVEEELIDDYFRGELNSKEHYAFMKNFLNTNFRRQRLQETVDSIRGLANSVSETDPFLEDFRTLYVTGAGMRRLRREGYRQEGPESMAFAGEVEASIMEQDDLQDFDSEGAPKERKHQPGVREKVFRLVKRLLSFFRH